MTGRNSGEPDDPLRVALVLDRFERLRGGLEHWTWQFALRLRAAGHEIHAVTFGADGDAADFGFQTHVLEPRSDRLARAGQIAGYLGQLRPDIVHDMGVGWHYDILHPHGGSRIADRMQNRLTLGWLGRLRQALHPAERRRWRELRALERSQYGAANGVVIAVSETVKADLVRFERVDPNRVRVIPNGVDTSAFERDVAAGRRLRSRLGLDRATVFIIIAHNFRLKGLAEAVQAMARVGPDAVLLVLGRGETGPYRQQARALGIENRVRFLGMVEDTRAHLSAADVCLHPTFYDPCSLVTLEALAAGLPVITTRRNGVSEMMTDGTEGLVLDDARDVVGLAASMTRMMDPALRARMGRDARALALKHDASRSFQDFVALYRQVADARQAGVAAPRISS